MPDTNLPSAEASARLAPVRIGLTGAAVAALVALGILAVAATASPARILAADPSQSPSGDASGNAVPALGDRHPGGPGHRFGSISITAIDGSSISLETADGWTRTITVDSGTTYTKAGATIALADLEVGDTVRFRQTLESDGSYSIDAVDVVLPHLLGTVTDVSGSTITLRLGDGSTGTVNVDANTTYRVGTDTSAALSDVKVGMILVAEGTKASDGSITASVIHAGDPGALIGPGRGDRHGHGFGPNGGPVAPDATSAPTSNG